MEIYDRISLIKYVIEKRRYKSYLEIGVDRGDVFNTLKNIESLEEKVGVDPNRESEATVFMTSDRYFMTCIKKFDLIFIDGLHLCDYVMRDMQNGLIHLNPGGMILMHDMLPPDEARMSRGMELLKAGGAWNGDCWRAFAKYIPLSPFLCYTLDMDEGIGVIDTANYANSNERGIFLDKRMMDLTWEDFQENRDRLLNVKPGDSAYTLI